MKGVKKKIAAALLLSNMLAWGGSAFAAGDTLVVSLGLKEEYNDNILFDAVNEEDDYITTLSPSVELRRRYERTSASLKGVLDIVEYSDNRELNNVDQLYSADFRHTLTQKISLSGGGWYKQDSRSDRDIEETGEVLSTSIRQKQKYNAGVGYIWSEKTSADVTYIHTRDDFEDPTDTDYDSHAVNLQLQYNLSSWLPLTTGRVNTGYSRYNYPNTKVDNYNLTIGGERQLSEIYSYYADLGARFTDPADGDSTTGTVLKCGIRYRGELTSGNAYISHGIAGASGGNGLRERTSFVVSARQRFTEELSGSVSGGVYLNKSNSGELSVGDIDERTIRISPQLTYRFTRNVKLETSYTYTRVVDKEKKDDDTKDRNLFFIRLVVAHSFFE